MTRAIITPGWMDSALLLPFTKVEAAQGQSHQPGLAGHGSAGLASQPSSCLRDALHTPFWGALGSSELSTEHLQIWSLSPNTGTLGDVTDHVMSQWSQTAPPSLAAAPWRLPDSPAQAEPSLSTTHSTGAPGAAAPSSHPLQRVPGRKAGVNSPSHSLRACKASFILEFPKLLDPLGRQVRSPPAMSP